MKLEKIVTGKNVFLREPKRADMDLFINAVRKSRKLHQPWVTPPDNSFKFHKYLGRVKRKVCRSFLVCRRADRAIAGVINLNEIVMGNLRSAYLGYYVFKGFDRQGFMSDGMKLLLEHAFKKLKFHRLEANIQPRNRASIGLVKSIGFQKEGYSPRYLKVKNRWRDHERWAITIETWKANRGR